MDNTTNLYSGIYKEPSSNFRPFAGQVAFPNLRETYSYRDTITAITKGEQTKKYREIAFNPIVSTALDLTINAVFWSGYTIVPQNNYNTMPQAKAWDIELIQAIKKQIDTLKNDSFTNIMKSLLYNSYVYGYAIAEIVWALQKGKWCVDKIKVKNSFNFNIERDEGGEIDYLEYVVTGQRYYRDLLPKFVIATYPYMRGDYFYGESKLASIYEDVKLLEILEQARATGTQLLSVRPIIHYYDGKREKAQLDNVFATVSKIDGASVLHFEMFTDPEDPSNQVKQDLFEVLDDRASSQGIKEIKEIINQIEKRIFRRLGIGDDLGMGQTSVGSYAKAKNVMNLFLMTTISGQEYITDVVNRQLIPAFLEYNYSTLPDNYKRPKIVFDTIEEDYMLKLTQSVNLLIQSGVIAPDEPWIRDLLDIPTDETKNIEKETKEDIANVTE